MIAKQVQGTDFKGVLDYIHGKSGARKIGSNMMGKDPESLTAEFRISSKLRERVTKRVYHASLSVSPIEKLSDRQWLKIARSFLEGMDFDGSQYVVYRHTDTEHDHVHIVASRIRITDGTVVGDSWQYRRAESIVRGLEEKFNLLPTPSSFNRRDRSPKTGEIRRQRRTGEVSKRSNLQAIVKKAIEGKPTLDVFVGRLKEEGINVRLRKTGEGKIEGISFGIDGVGFQGRQLGKDYSWPNLQTNLATETNEILTVIDTEGGEEMPRDRDSPPITIVAVIPEIPTVAVKRPPRERSIETERTRVSAETSSPAFPTVAAKSSSIEVKAETVNPEVLPLITVENNEINERKERLRGKYVTLAEQVRNYPGFRDVDARKVDTGVAILSLKSGESREETELILTRSDRVEQWREELPREVYLKRAIEYIRQVTREAIELMRQSRERSKNSDLER
ncbi:relaxase/mobilization nuclease domain-containing protein [Pannus brasiliensis CCIBt3594]|uniref:Relaxase/mobilization nuclease domain-containing protein n=1 Tax=Pannus brasiliensis CCIBt3594 TaxID=1427578 RepID=A0AAW9QJ83_9CHRO